jgi:hypothetical protein
MSAFTPTLDACRKARMTRIFEQHPGIPVLTLRGAALDQWGALLVEQLSQWVEELVLNDLFATMCIVFLVVGHFEYFVPARKIPGATTRRS